MIELNNFIAEYAEIKQEIDSVISSVLKSGQYILGDNVDNFERKLAKFIGVKYCVGVASGTDAITLSLLANGIGTGDEVITTNFTAYPTVAGIINSGAKPILVDVSLDNALIDVNLIEAAISQKTRVIIPVHLYGHPCNMNAIKKICEKYNLILIEDCAQALGAEYNTNKIGSLGNCGAFSFYPTKNIGAYGDAGAVVTNNESVYNQLISLRNYGNVKGHLHQENGLNSRLDEIQAAILGVKLKYVEKWNNRRIIIGDYYSNYINGHDLFSLDANVKHVYHIFSIRSKKRETLMNHLKNSNIETKVHYPATIHQNNFVHSPNMSNYYKSTLLANEVMSIPINPWLTENEILTVVNSINEFKYG